MFAFCALVFAMKRMLLNVKILIFIIYESWTKMGKKICIAELFKLIVSTGTLCNGNTKLWLHSNNTHIHHIIVLVSQHNTWGRQKDWITFINENVIYRISILLNKNYYNFQGWPKILHNHTITIFKRKIVYVDWI